ncbi:MAG: hypothetical protein IZT55_04385, partial [Anaerolineae bacterium]|nr:hypothetical protein [Anaerolineae bacterium]
MTDFHKIPSVDKLLQTEEINILVEKFGRPLAIDTLRSTL